MSSKDNRIYRNKRPAKIIITSLLIFIAVLLLLIVTIFFGFRKYIVYTDNGIRLEVPWLEEVNESSSAPES